MPRRVRGQNVFINYAHPLRLAPLQHPDLDWRQQRALGYFRERAALALGSPFCLDIWDKHFLLLSEHHPCVRSAVIALGSIHEDLTTAENPSPSEYALSQYGKAIQGVVDLCTSKHSQAVEVALTTCILFACLENMRGFIRSCLTHLASGLNVLQEHGSKIDPTYHSVVPMGQLCFLFVQLDSQLADIGGVEFDRSVRPYKEPTNYTPQEFHSLHEAMQDLEMLFNRVQWFGRDSDQIAAEQGTSKEVLAPLYARRQHLRSELQGWRLAFARMIARDEADQTNTDHQAGMLALKLLSDAISIMLTLDVIATQVEFDACLPTFQTIVANAETFIALTATSPTPKIPSPFFTTPISNLTPSAGSTPQPSTFPTFTMTTGCVFPLYFTTARCRHSPTRHRALHLLQHCNRREGLWDSTLAGHIAARLVALEESSATASTPPSQQPSSTTPQVDPNNSSRDSADGSRLETPVPDDMRVRVVNVDFTDTEGGRAAFSMQPLGFATPGERFAGMQFAELVQW